MTFEAVVERFAARRSGSGWMARCPAHEDAKASLSIAPGDDGRTLIKCFAGCAAEAVTAAASLTMADLQPERIDKPQIVACYDYTDEGGALLFQAVRFSPKDFRQRRPDGAGGWIWKLDKVRRVLFGLPELRTQKVAYLVEGEKDVLALRAIGLVGTTNAGGAGKWTDDYARQLHAAGVESIVVLPDNDEPGRQHGATLARSCHAAGLRVKIVSLPALPPKGDVSDWLDAGHTREELIAIVKAAPLFVASGAAASVGLELTALSDLLAEPDEAVDYLIEDRIACGSVAILAGKPKAGKSTAARGLALEVGRGGSWLGFSCLPRPVWYLALEDKRSEVRRHFRMMGATGAEPVRFLFRQPTDHLIAQLHALAEREHPGLIVVDTLQRLIRAQDLNDYAEVTTKLTPILMLARETGAAVLLVHHAGKSERAGIDAVLGSTALTGSVDNVFILSRTDRFRVLSSVQRIGPDLPETVIMLDPETGRVHAGLSRHDADRQTVEVAILAALGEGGGVTEAELNGRVEGRTIFKREALRALVQTGRVRRDGRGGKGDPFRYAIRVPEAGNINPDSDEPAADARSCSLVPSYSREQQNKNLLFGETSSNTGPDDCSHVPGPVAVAADAREHQSADEADEESWRLP